MTLTMVICAPVLKLLGARQGRNRRWLLRIGDCDSVIKLTSRGWVFDGQLVETVGDMLAAAYHTGRKEGREEIVAQYQYEQGGD